jgi:hypothetical protein
MLTNADCNNESLALHFVATYSLVTICFSVHTARQLSDLFVGYLVTFYQLGANYFQ